jgi:hypothetical protein
VAARASALAYEKIVAKRCDADPCSTLKLIFSHALFQTVSPFGGDFGVQAGLGKTVSPFDKLRVPSLSRERFCR